MREAKNAVRIEGILSEIDLEYGSYTKEGKSIDCIRGSIKILVNQVINGQPTDIEVPVFMFSQKFTNAGKPNPAYESIVKIKNEYSSIAATGSIATADRVRITNGKVQMNEYYNPEGRLISFPRVSASFVSRLRKEDKLNPEATFAIEMVVANKDFKKDIDGNDIEPKKFIVKGITPGYGGRIEIIDFVCANEKVQSAVEDYWELNSTVEAKGRLNFSSKTETFKEDQGFGEPIERSRTISVSELVITGGSEAPLEGEFAYDMAEIKTALADHRARLEAQKSKDMNKENKRQAPAPNSSNGKLDLGF